MYEINEEQRKNLLILLDRVEFKGLKEVEAVNDIILALHTKKEE